MGRTKSLQRSAGEGDSLKRSAMNQNRLEMQALFHQATCHALRQTIIPGEERISLIFFKADGQHYKPDTSAIAAVSNAGVDIPLTSEGFVISTIGGAEADSTTKKDADESGNSCSVLDELDRGGASVEKTDMASAEDQIIERIVGCRERRQYLIKWHGYSEEHNSWEDENIIKGRPIGLQAEVQENL
ncbi:hypothetical protein RvY_10882 [Ramazzottius varieornatus]|uniref:Chromo domain-containing protein n=1 Tax=Ramazzottius varieornatus TaxID=947166 RepID=A0A1D1VE91_RAMVA|nr:hypothetical protein RvY_10882 [Ramazzottius varieornatus]